MTSTIDERSREVIAEFSMLEDWTDRYTHLIEQAATLPPIDESDRTDENKVRGCQSQVWMVAELDEATRKVAIRADSDAFIVRGLIALLLRLYADRHPQEILANPPEVFNEIGLGAHLSPTRANGLHAMIKRIRQLAAAQVHGVEVAAAQ
jgi:cysteine desulfuration protein SufE